MVDILGVCQVPSSSSMHPSPASGNMAFEGSQLIPLMGAALSNRGTTFAKSRHSPESTPALTAHVEIQRLSHLISVRDNLSS